MEEQETVKAMVRRLVEGLREEREKKYGRPCLREGCPSRTTACADRGNVVPFKRRDSTKGTK